MTSPVNVDFADFFLFKTSIGTKYFDYHTMLYITGACYPVTKERKVKYNKQTEDHVRQDTPCEGCQGGDGDTHGGDS